MEDINYKIGDSIASKENPDKIIGVCTGFTPDDTCVVIDGKVWGGKLYFSKADVIDIPYEVVEPIQ